MLYTMSTISGCFALTIDTSGNTPRKAWSI